MATERFTLKELEKIDLSKPMRKADFARLAGVGRARIGNAINLWKIRIEPDGMIIPSRPINKYFLSHTSLNFQRIMRLARTDREIFKYYGALLNKALIK